jgi:sn-glycerol 3-phosphate transport system ATP-binding protein/multiple sugar transport system ATP-binding protein
MAAVTEGVREKVRSAPAAEETPLPQAKPRAVRCEARGVKKAFGQTAILKGVDVAIEEGSFAVLVGSSGCGKSTLLRLVAGLETPDEGTIHLAGRDVTALEPRERDVAMVFQSYALYPHLTVRENLAFGLELRKTPASEIASRIGEASSMLGLDALLDRLPKQLSGGQRQRVAMGRAIVRRPNIFLFDEPLSNLDAALRAEVRVDIRRLHDRLGATTLYVTHDQVEAMTLADVLWVMNKGHVEQKGAPLEIYEKPRSLFVATFLGSPAMNLSEGKLTSEGGVLWAETPDLRVAIDESRFGANLTEGRAITVGVRPHDFVLGDDQPAGTLVVEVVEALGFEAFAHGWIRQAGPRFVVRVGPECLARVRAGQKVGLQVPKEKVHLFDPKTGLSLAR